MLFFVRELLARMTLLFSRPVATLLRRCFQCFYTPRISNGRENIAVLICMVARRLYVSLMLLVNVRVTGLVLDTTLPCRLCDVGHGSGV